MTCNINDEYQQQAISFLDRFGFSFRATYKDGACPPWCGEDSTGCRHGNRYRITISRRSDYVCNEGRSPRRISFDFWNSEADMRAGKQPTPYDVLAAISFDVNAPETFEDFCDEYGYDRDSRKAESTFRRVDRFARRLRKFFSPHEIDALAELQ